jgi:predicted enzyme related to lactoylglutathione lyase
VNGVGTLRKSEQFTRPVYDAPGTTGRLTIFDSQGDEHAISRLVDDVIAIVAGLAAAGCRVLVTPFDVRIGKCAVLADPFGNKLNLI